MSSERLKKTAINAVANIISLAVSGLAGLIVMRFVLLYLGSDYNGLNSVTSQVMTILLIVSTSFTTASLVSLYKPYNENDWAKLNCIISTTRKAYKLIGLAMALIGSLVCIAYAYTIQSSIDVSVIIIVLMISLTSAVFNVAIINTYRLVYQVSQTEYIVTFATTCYILVASILACLAAYFTSSIIVMRICYMIPEMISGAAIAFIARRKFKKLSFSSNYDYSLIKGTRDVLATSITSVIYQSSPTIFLASLVGTAATSVYYVYYSIIVMIKNVAQVLIDAPKNAFGQIVHLGDKRETSIVFRQYEYIMVFATTCLMAPTLGLILPFVSVYTKGVSGANYNDPIMALMLVLISFIEISHIPSGLAIQLSGEFKLMKKIQYIAMVVLIVLLVAGGVLLQIYGVLTAILLAAVLLTALEVVFAGKYVVTRSTGAFFKIFIPHLLLLLVMGMSVNVIVSSLINDYLSFAVVGFIVLSIDVAIVSLFGKLFYKNAFSEMISVVGSIFKSK